MGHRSLPRLVQALIASPHLLGLSVALILVAGLAAWTSLPRIEDPRITTRNALVVTPLPGGDAERVESLVTKPLEDALREVAEVKTIESTSRAGISLISVELDDTVGPDENQALFSKIRDRLAEAESLLPPEAGRPELDDMRGAVAYSLVAALTWRDASEPQMAVLDRLSLELADRLRNLPGTEQVVRFGAADEEILVGVDPDELAAIGMTIPDLAARLAAADVKRPAGTLRPPGSRMQLEVAGSFETAERIAAVPLAGSGADLVRVGDIARVEKTWSDPPGEIAYQNGRRAILVGVRTRPGVHLDQWSEQARAIVADFAPLAGAGISVDLAFDQSRYTNARLSALGGNLGAGALVVMAVVLLTMGWRAALVVGAALPLSAALTLFGLDVAGGQIHQMSVFGMIIALGLLIDNAIVITDEVRTRLAEGLTPARAARAAVAHLATPLGASTFTTILGFMPVFLLPGNIGDFVGSVATSVILALAASFLLSMTLIPALAARFARPSAGRDHRWWRDGWSSPVLACGYRRLLTRSMERPGLTLVVSLILPVSGFWAAGQLPSQFFPPSDRDQIEVQVWRSPASSIGGTAGTVRAVDTMIRGEDGVRASTWVVGASSPPVYYNQLRNQDGDPAYARGTILAEDEAAARRLVERLQGQLSDAFPEARIVVRAFGQGPPIPAPVSLRLVGPDTDRLRLLGEQVRALLAEQPAVTESKAGIQGGEPKLWLQADEQEAGALGLGLSGIAAQLQGALEGSVGGRVIEDLEDLPVRVRYPDDERADASRIASLRLIAPGTGPDAEPRLVPAEALGALVLRPQVQAITRRNGERVNMIQAWLTPDALPIEVTSAVQARIDAGALTLPPGYRIETAGDSEESGEAVGQLLAYAPVLATLMLAALVLSFRSFALAGIVAASGLLSLGLGFFALWIAGFPLGFNPILGSAGLLGVAINASIVVLAAIRAEPAASAGQVPAVVDAVMRSTRHIVSTTLTTVGGFMPLVLAGGAFWPPLAIVIAGGVGLGIFLGLFMTPALYLLTAGRLREVPASLSAHSEAVA